MKADITVALDSGHTLRLGSDDCSFDLTNELREVTCADAGCDGYRAVHREMTGKTTLRLVADAVGVHWDDTAAN